MRRFLRWGVLPLAVALLWQCGREWDLLGVLILGLAALHLSLFARGMLCIRSRLFGPVIWRCPREGDCCHLTFDDGPTPGATEAVLELLAAHSARATFFLVGENIRRHPDLARRIVAEGHAVGNHSERHAALMPIWGSDRVAREIRRVDQLIRTVTGRPSVGFRPPAGLRSLAMHRACLRLDVPVIGWSARAADTLAWSAETIARRLARGLQPGAILLLHDGIIPRLPAADRQAMLQALEQVLLEMKARGLRSVPLPCPAREKAHPGSPAATAEQEASVVRPRPRSV
jgi:peptidoglycan/xylan/chitin deacetylase (PgdA/CDA1 family)